MDSIIQRWAGKHLLSSTSAVCRTAERYSSTTVTARKKKRRKKEKKNAQCETGNAFAFSRALKSDGKFESVALLNAIWCHHFFLLPTTPPKM